MAQKLYKITALKGDICKQAISMLNVPGIFFIDFSSRRSYGKIEACEQSNYLEAWNRLACSRFRGSPLNLESANTKIKREETGERRGGGSCNHFFERPVTVYQLLVYPLTGQISHVKFEKDSNSLTFQPFDSRHLIISNGPKVGGRSSQKK